MYQKVRYPPKVIDPLTPKVQQKKQKLKYIAEILVDLTKYLFDLLIQQSSLETVLVKTRMPPLQSLALPTLN